MSRLMHSFILRLCVLFLCVAPAWAFEVQEVTSPGGIKAWLVTTRTVPLIAMNFSFEGGSTLDPPGKEGAVNFITGMLDEGADDLSGPAFQTARDDIAMKLSFNVSLDRFEGNFQTLSSERKTAFALLRKSLTMPRFEEQAVDRIRQQFILMARNAADDPAEISKRQLMKQAFGEHPYARPTEGTEASIKAITRQDLINLHGLIFNQRSLNIAVVGDIDKEELGPLLDEVFGQLSKAAPPPPPPPATLAKPSTSVVERDIPQSVFSFMSPGILREDPDFIPAFVLSQILGGGDFGSRLMTELRVKRGLTYGISYNLVPLKSAGFYLGSFSTRNEKAGEAMAMVRETMVEMAKQGPSQQELDEIKTFLTGSYALGFNTNANIAEQLLSQKQRGLPIDYTVIRNDKIKAITLEQVKAQAKRLLQPELLITVAVGKPKQLVPAQK